MTATRVVRFHLDIASPCLWQALMQHERFPLRDVARPRGAGRKRSRLPRG